MKREAIFEFFRRLAEDNPSPQTELEFGNTYQLLVAVVLSAQATDVGVNKATRALFREVQTPQQMLALGEEGLKQHIKTIGLFNAKAKNVIALSEILVRDHGGEVPADRDVLTTLPGVGRKTANVVMNCAFGAETFAVDTHIFRVGNRTGIAPGKDETAVERAIAIAGERGAKRSVLLPVSAPFHCRLMQPAADEMQEALAGIAMRQPAVPLVANVTAAAVSDPDTVRELLVRQVTGMVRWRESVLAMKEAGVSQVFEIGAGKVLTGLVKRIDREIAGQAVGEPADIEAALKLL